MSHPEDQHHYSRQYLRFVQAHREAFDAAYLDGNAQAARPEAELRARVERLTAWVRSRTKADALSDEQIGKAVDQWYIGLPAALDAAEQHHPEVEGK